MSETGPQVKREAVKIIAPGHDAGNARLEQSFEELLLRIISSVAELPAAETVEYLAVRGAPRQHTFVTASTTDCHNTGQLGVDGVSAGDSTDRTDFVRNLAGAAETMLPGWFGVEIGELILDPIGLTAVPTSRLLLDTTVSEDEGSLTDTRPSHIRQVCQRLTHHRKPSLYQVIVRDTGTDTYEVTIRLGILTTGRRPITGQQVAATIDEGLSCPLAETTPDRYISSLDLADRYWNVARDPSPWEAEYGLTIGYLGHRDLEADVETCAWRSQQLLVDFPEYRDLLRGIHETDRYDCFEVEPTLDLTEEQLSQLLGPLPWYGPGTWIHDAERDLPIWQPTETRSEAAGTDRGLPNSADSHPEHADGSVPDQSLRGFTRAWLRQLGCDPTTPTSHKPNRREPAFYGHPTDDEGPVLIVDGTVNHGDIIQNAVWAEQSDRKLLIVTDEEPTARECISALRTPFERHTESGVRLYTRNALARRTSDTIPVVPPKSDPPTWELTAEGSLSLHYEGRVVASGAAPANVDTFEYRLPSLVASGAIFDSDGDRLDHYASWKEALNHWRPVRVPAQPAGLTHLSSAAAVLYRQAYDLTWARPEPMWGDDTDYWNARTRGCRTFIDTYTIQRSGASTTGFFDQFASWYWPQGYRTSPNRLEIEETIPRSIQTTAVADEDAPRDQRIELQGRRWRYPPGLDPPTPHAPAMLDTDGDPTK